MSQTQAYLLSALRDAMKTAGVNYTQLSKLCNVPVSSLKRQFHNPSLGIDKVIYYASFLNTDLIELATQAKKLQQADAGSISVCNNKIFGQYPYLYDFVYKLIYEKLTIEQIQQQHELSDHATQYYLRILEMMGYLTIIEKKSVKMVASMRLRSPEGTPVDGLFVNRFLSHQRKTDKRPNLCMTQVKLTDEQLLILENNFYEQYISFHHQNTANPEAKPRNVLMSIYEGSHILLSDSIPNISGDLLKEVATMLKTER